jgi:hypothetical protein
MGQRKLEGIMCVWGDNIKLDKKFIVFTVSSTLRESIQNIPE